MRSAHQAMIESVTRAFSKTFGASNDVAVVMAPGRVNLIGEYTDFNEGFVFPMTVDRGVYIAIRRRDDSKVRVASIRYQELIEYELDRFERPEPGSWSSYVLGVVEELRARGLVDRGFDAIFDGNLDPGAGLSSSAALEIATGLSLQHVFGFEMPRVDMVKLCQFVEHSYAEVLCGIMDQFASGIGRAGHALLLDCRSLDCEHVPIESGDYRVVIINSEVKRSLASSAYNARRGECEQGIEFFRQHDETISALRDVSPDLFESEKDRLSAAVGRRCRHVISENKRVKEGVAALKAGRLDQFGKLMSASHRSLRDDFEVSCPELDLLVDLANETDGVLGSRMTGAGFGGCTVSLVHEDAIDLLEARLSVYTSRFDRLPQTHVLEGNLAAGAVSKGC